MIELPEAVVLSSQIEDRLVGKVIREITVLQSPHKFAWFHGDAEDYPGLLRDKAITGAESHGGMVQMRLAETSLAFQDGPNLRYVEKPSALPKKHQLLLEFTDATFFCVSIQMYGGIACFEGTDWDNDYYRPARERPSPLSEGFTWEYFLGLTDEPKFDKLSAKAFLATEQRIPGLGNGVLQDILFNAGIHPKRKMATVPDEALHELFSSLKETLRAMAEGGGRNTERDLLGHPGGYRTILSRLTVGKSCPRCETVIQKASFGGGSVYFCSNCQPLE
jgi:formamidopyrimidine-DNA glycosylase